MSTFERDGYEWRETYLLFFESARRPTLQAAEARLKRANPQFEFEDGVTDDDGLLESLTVMSAADFAAVDICFDDGDEIGHQASETAAGYKPAQLDAEEQQKVAKLANCDSRYDLLHFGRIVADDLADEPDDDLLDPSTLLAVMDAMIELTGGVGIDPASGTLV
jgi:hypothetical protein